jgi:hypothetical protein
LEKPRIFNEFLEFSAFHRFFGGSVEHSIDDVSWWVIEGGVFLDDDLLVVGVGFSGSGFVEFSHGEFGLDGFFATFG